MEIVNPKHFLNLAQGHWDKAVEYHQNYKNEIKEYDKCIQLHYDFKEKQQRQKNEKIKPKRKGKTRR